MSEPTPNYTPVIYLVIGVQVLILAGTIWHGSNNEAGYSIPHYAVGALAFGIIACCGFLLGIMKKEKPK